MNFEELLKSKVFWGATILGASVLATVAQKKDDWGTAEEEYQKSRRGERGEILSAPDEDEDEDDPSFFNMSVPTERRLALARGYIKKMEKAMKARIEVDDILDKARKRLAKIPDFPEKEKVDEAMRVAMVRMEEEYYDIAGDMKGWEKRIKDTEAELKKEKKKAPDVVYESQEEPPSGEHKRVIDYIMGEVSRATGKQYPHLRQELTRLSLNALLELKLLVGDFSYQMTVLKKKSQMGYPFHAPAMEGLTESETQAVLEEARRQDPKVMMKELDVATKQWGQMYSKAGFDVQELQKIQEKYYTPVRKEVEEYFRQKNIPADIQDINIFIVNEKMKTVWGHIVSEEFISKFPKDAAPGEGIAVVELPDIRIWFFIFNPKTFKIRRGEDISPKGVRISEIQAQEKAYKEKLAKLTGEKP